MNLSEDLKCPDKPIEEEGDGVSVCILSIKKYFWLGILFESSKAKGGTL
jgi:hypothetical protein